MVKIKFGHVMAVDTDFHAKNKKILFRIFVSVSYSETLKPSRQSNRIESNFFNLFRCFYEFGSIKPN